jgi:hypothetical protein
MAAVGGNLITMAVTPLTPTTLATAIGATTIGATIITGDALGRSKELRPFLRRLAVRPTLTYG